MIDLRSDTVTQPSPAMRRAMAEAVVGDDVYRDDPTVLKLEQRAAELMGKEAGLFVSSGTLGNLLALMSQTERGDEIIAGRHSHIVTHEVGGAAQIAQVMVHPIDHPQDWIEADAIRNAVHSEDIHEPRTRLVCLENALSNGGVVPLPVLRSVYDAAKALGLRVHLDGARILNAALASGCSVQRIADCADTVTFCLSKGLAAPVGSVLTGDQAFIERARRNRKLLGGGLRQAGILAAAGLVALDSMTQRLAEDHAHAKLLGSLLAAIDGISVETERIQINMVFFKVDREKRTPEDFLNQLKEKGILTNPDDHGLFRFVTHYGIMESDVRATAQAVREIMEG